VLADAGQLLVAGLVTHAGERRAPGCAVGDPARIPLSEIPLSEILLSEIPLSESTSRVAVEILLSGSCSSTYDCSLVNCLTATLGDAAARGAIRPNVLYAAFAKAVLLSEIPLSEVPLSEARSRVPPVSRDHRLAALAIRSARSRSRIDEDHQLLVRADRLHGGPDRHARLRRECDQGVGDARRRREVLDDRFRRSLSEVPLRRSTSRTRRRNPLWRSRSTDGAADRLRHPCRLLRAVVDETLGDAERTAC
jgi:hypothetical protein